MYPHPIANAFRAEVLRDYEPGGDWQANQLRLKKGETVWVIEQDASGWWGGHRESDDVTAWFPSDLVRRHEQESESALGDVSRCSPSGSLNRTEHPLFTSDNRRVASPQANARGRAAQDAPTDQENRIAMVPQRELQEKNVELHEAILSLRNSQKECQEARARHLAERQKDKENFERERLQWEQRAREWEQRAHEKEAENRRLQEDLQRLRPEPRKVDEKAVASLPSRDVVPAAWCAPEMTSSRSCLDDDAVLARNGSGLHRSISGSTGADQRKQVGQTAVRADARTATANIPRQLFAQDGSRTPPAPLGHAGAASAPTISTVNGVPTIQAPALHARPNMSTQQLLMQASGCPRPSPRTVQSTAGWMGGSATVNVPTSPRSRQRGFTTNHGSESAGGSVGPPVRALVSSWERRSNSQGAPPCRIAAEPSQAPQVIYAARAACRTASRDQREAPVRIASRTRLPDAVEPDSARNDTDVAAVVNLGMSPMPRQHTHLHQTPRHQTQTLASPSPSAKGMNGIVQDRIRQLNLNR